MEYYCVKVDPVAVSFPNEFPPHSQFNIMLSSRLHRLNFENPEHRSVALTAFNRRTTALPEGVHSIIPPQEVNDPLMPIEPGIALEIGPQVGGERPAEFILFDRSHPTESIMHPRLPVEERAYAVVNNGVIEQVIFSVDHPQHDFSPAPSVKDLVSSRR